MSQNQTAEKQEGMIMVTFHVTPECMRYLRMLARQRGISVSGLVRVALDAMLTKYREFLQYLGQKELVVDKESGMTLIPGRTVGESTDMIAQHSQVHKRIRRVSVKEEKRAEWGAIYKEALSLIPEVLAQYRGGTVCLSVSKFLRLVGWEVNPEYFYPVALALKEYCAQKGCETYQKGRGRRKRYVFCFKLHDD